MADILAAQLDEMREARTKRFRAYDGMAYSSEFGGGGTWPQSPTTTSVAGS